MVTIEMVGAWLIPGDSCRSRAQRARGQDPARQRAVFGIDLRQKVRVV
jgi:hypothetical protein